ncbi:hypothetical protein NtRootA9_26130 [Arthrobacter sp. NtRootA9]|nr:hypothetical protein NtRootA9_26130 [Arthrobacter sp. NtRootA9]
MLSAENSDSINVLLVWTAALLGAALSPIAEVLIAKLLPRLGSMPRLQVRITTAAVSGTACAAFAARFGISWTLPAFLLLAVLGVQLVRIDISQHLLPNPLVICLLAGGLFLLLMPTIFDQHTDHMFRSLLGAVILFSGYLVMSLISPGAVGMGDVKLAAPIGLYLGYLGWSHLLYGGLLGFVLNGLISLAAVSRKSVNRPSEVPHGPSMLGATAVMSLLSL